MNKRACADSAARRARSASACSLLIRPPRVRLAGLKSNPFQDWKGSAKREGQRERKRSPPGLALWRGPGLAGGPAATKGIEQRISRIGNGFGPDAFIRVISRFGIGMVKSSRNGALLTYLQCRIRRHFLAFWAFSRPKLCDNDPHKPCLPPRGSKCRMARPRNLVFSRSQRVGLRLPRKTVMAQGLRIF